MISYCGHRHFGNNRVGGADTFMSVQAFRTFSVILIPIFRNYSVVLSIKTRIIPLTPLRHTLHLYQPLGTADGGMDDGTGDVGIDVGHHAVDKVVVGEIAEIDDEILDVVHSGSTVGKEGSDVLKQAGGLLADVAEIDHLSLVVDTGSAGDII